MNFQMLKLDFEKAEEPEIKLPTSVGSLKNQENSRKTSISALLTTPKPLTVWITTNCRKFLPDHLTCLLRNLYAGQETTVRTRHRTTDWCQIGKGVHQSCILSPCLFNLYAEQSHCQIYILKKVYFKKIHTPSVHGSTIYNSEDMEAT